MVEESLTTTLECGWEPLRATDGNDGVLVEGV